MSNITNEERARRAAEAQRRKEISRDTSIAFLALFGLFSLIRKFPKTCIIFLPLIVYFVFINPSDSTTRIMRAAVLILFLAAVAIIFIIIWIVRFLKTSMKNEDKEEE